LFTILTDYESFLVSGEQIERLNHAKITGAEDVWLGVSCGCGTEHGARTINIRITEVAGVIAHRDRNPASNVIAFKRTG
jgi:hypothetical protein